ncbi:MAG: hypothetical protein U0235_13420 [Polyangiaceae bacterium]
MRYVDAAGREAERYFINILSAGMGGLVDRYVADAHRACSAHRRLLRSFAPRAHDDRAGSPPRRGHRGRRDPTGRFRLHMIAICNGRYFGSGMRIAPMAAVDDGKLEVIAIGGNKLALLGLSRAVYSGEHLGRAGTRHFACRRISLIENAADAAATRS